MLNAQCSMLNANNYANTDYYDNTDTNNDNNTDTNTNTNTMRSMLLCILKFSA